MPAGRGHGDSRSRALHGHSHRLHVRQGGQQSQGRTDKRSPVRTNAHDKLQRHGDFPVRRELCQPDYRHKRWLLPEGHGRCHQRC